MYLLEPDAYQSNNKIHLIEREMMAVKPENSQLEQMNSSISDIISRRGQNTPGYNPIRYIELNGGRIIEPTAFEPDASTYRGDYYYNAVSNVLYKKITVRTKPVTVAHWKKVSN